MVCIACCDVVFVFCESKMLAWIFGVINCSFVGCVFGAASCVGCNSSVFDSSSVYCGESAGMILFGSVGSGIVFCCCAAVRICSPACTSSLYFLASIQFDALRLPWPPRNVVFWVVVSPVCVVVSSASLVKIPRFNMYEFDKRLPPKFGWSWPFS